MPAYFLAKPRKNIKNGLGLASKTRALAPPRQNISLLASVVLRVRVCAAAVRENAKPRSVVASLAACVALNSRDRHRSAYLIPRMHDRA